ncbi:MAG: elongation factor Ts [Candidatus Parcubacteria bacterium]|nr:MAG: elongation factor Ts [Candidatus Parcubacteria bacterium]
MDKELIEKIKKIREETSAPINLCKEALEQSNGDLELAKKYIIKKGEYLINKKSDNLSNNGIIEGYIHFNGRVASLIDLRCQTDFVARSDEFKKLAHEIAIQIATMNPKYLSSDKIPEEIINDKIREFEEEFKDKPQEIKNKIIENKLQKWYEEVCLMDQFYFKDENLKIKDLIHQAVNKFGEKIEIKRFIRLSIND